MRGQYILEIKQARKQFNAESQELQDRERMCELTHVGNQSDVTYTELLEANRPLALHFTKLTHTSWERRAESLFEQGDKNGKLLAVGCGTDQHSLYYQLSGNSAVRPK